MSDEGDKKPAKSWVQLDLEDSLDEELEMEIDDFRLDNLLEQVTTLESTTSLDRKDYLHHLVRQQVELVKLLDCVIKTG